MKEHSYARGELAQFRRTCCVESLICWWARKKTESQTRGLTRAHLEPRCCCLVADIPAPWARPKKKTGWKGRDESRQARPLPHPHASPSHVTTTTRRHRDSYCCRLKMKTNGCQLKMDFFCVRNPDFRDTMRNSHTTDSLSRLLDMQ